MSRFFSDKYASLTPYTPGEQPQDKRYIKLNTNESPFPPSKKAQAYGAEAAKQLELYPDPTYQALTDAVAKQWGVTPDEVILVNGSDEVLNFAFMAFCDDTHPAVFPDITYGFYKVFAACNGIPYEEKPLQDDFTLDVNDYRGVGKTIFLANPNAPTGLCLPLSEIERIVSSNPDSVVVIDEAYVDFGGESCVPLIHQYDNLLVTQTFSKSRSMAGARLGLGIGNAALIRDLNTIKYSTNPYNLNRMTAAAGLGVLEDEEYTLENCRTVMENRAYTAAQLQALGFEVIPSAANFVLARHPRVSGKILYQQLKERGILVRHFDTPRLTDYNRITIGSHKQMETLINTLESILSEVTL